MTTTNNNRGVHDALETFGWQDHGYDDLRELADDMLDAIQAGEAPDAAHREAFMDVEAIARGGMDHRGRVGAELDFVTGESEIGPSAKGAAEQFKDALGMIPPGLLRLRYMEWLVKELGRYSNTDTSELWTAITIRYQENDDIPLEDETVNSFSDLADKIAAGEPFTVFRNVA